MSKPQKSRFALAMTASAWLFLGTGPAVPATVSAHGRPAHLIAELGSATGSTIGPDGALYVTQGASGQIFRIDPKTRKVKTFATGLPPAVIGLGGVMDVAFIGQTAYALVTLVGPDVGGSNIVGIYRRDGPNNWSVLADIGAFAIANPPRTPFDVPTGLQFALDVYQGGFLVTDGHHNRVLRVTLSGAISEFEQFDNIVPTGLTVAGDWVYLAQAGPIPHAPENGKIFLLRPPGSAREVASGASLLVDVELRGRGGLYALSQGKFPPDGAPAEPALPDTGALLRVNWDGSFAVVAGGLDRPVSLEFIRGDAYVVTLGGEVWAIAF